MHESKFLLASIILFYHRKYLSWYSLKSLLLHVPYIKNKITSNALQLEQSLNTSYTNYNRLPIKKLSLREVLEKTDSITNKSNKEHISGIIYHNNDHHINDMAAVFKKFASSNPLHPDIFPEIREMEIDIIQMVRTMFNGDDNVCGNVTSGGTESILLAIYSYREWGRKEHGITRPNIVAFHSVHPAFDKACHYFGIKIKKISSLLRMKMSIDWNTICVVGSAPTYGYGIVDPIYQMADHCYFRNVPFHVDCCMGGFLMPFLENNPVSFKTKGITSISADSHKYGNCFKGSSILLFKSWKYKQHQHFIKTDWEGGMYATPTLLGSKSGALIATTWASMLLTGEEKYTQIARSIQTATLKICDAFRENKDIEVIGEPYVNIVAFASKKHDIYKIASFMEKWNLSILTNPFAFHFCITSVHTDSIIDEFISNLKEAIRKTKESPESSLTGTLAIYGSAAKVENSLFTSNVVNYYIGLLSSRNIFKLT